MSIHLKKALTTKTQLILVIAATRIRQGGVGGGVRDEWGKISVQVAMSRVCMLEIPASEEQVQEGATSRCLDI